MMKLEIATIMRRAWRLAKSAVKRFDKGTAREYLAEAIRMSWALWRKDNKPVRPVTYSLPVAEVVADQIDGAATVAAVEVTAEVDAVQAVAVARVAKTNTFLSKIATAAQKAFTGIKNFFTGAVTIELARAHG